MSVAIDKLGEDLRRMSDYLDRGRPGVKRIGLRCDRGSLEQVSGVEQRDGKFYFKGREVYLLHRPKR